MLFHVSHVIFLFFAQLICFLSFLCVCNGSQLQDGNRERNSTLIFSQAKPSYYFLLLCLLDTHSGTDLRLSVNATGLLCNSILPLVTLYSVLHVVFIVLVIFVVVE